MAKKKMMSIVALGAILLCFCLANLVRPTFAYYSRNGSTDNKMILKGSTVFLEEIFDPYEHWLPGETKTKNVDFGNQGEGDQVIRFKVDIEWKDAGGATFNPADSGYADAVTLHWTQALVGADGDPSTLDAGQEWQLVDGYYYYIHVLKGVTSSGAVNMTGAVLTGVTFSDKLSSDSNHTTDFSKAKCNITVTMESLDVNSEVVGVQWSGRSFVQNGNVLTWA